MSTKLSLATKFNLRQASRDNRKSARTSHQTKAWIRLDGGFAVRPCVLVDLSNTGARLRVEAPQVVPKQISLLLSRYSVKGRRCQVKWRRGVHVGVEFL